MSSTEDERQGITADSAQAFREIVTALGGAMRTEPGSEPRLFFPKGISLISLDVTVGPAHVVLKISSDPKETDQAPSGTAREQRATGLLFAPPATDLTLGQKVPDVAEVQAVGAIAKKIRRTDPEFATLVENQNPDIVFKDEEGTGADRMMTPKLQGLLDALATSVEAEWSGVNLRVTEAWDEDDEHGPNSTHYEGRAADLTTSPVDPAKLGRLGRLAVDAGFGWVFYENEQHVHVSVAK